METRKHLAAEKKRLNTHNCAQAVTCTYCDLVGLDEQTALDIAGAYGTGMGNMEGTCGALVGAGMIVGLATKDRIQSRARMKEMMEKFQARNGATQCRLLKGIGTGKPLRDCPDCVADASEFLEEYLWTGHSDYQTINPYIDIAEKTKADAMKLFEQEMEK